MDDLHILIIALVTWLVTSGLKAFAEWRGIQFTGVVNTLVMAVVALILYFVNPVIATIPESYITPIQMVAGILVLLLTGFGVRREVRKLRPGDAFARALKAGK